MASFFSKPSLQAAAISLSDLIRIQLRSRPICYPWSSSKCNLLWLVGFFSRRSLSTASPRSPPAGRFFVFSVGLQKVLLSKCNLLLEKQGCPYPSTQTNIAKKYDLVWLQSNKRNITGGNKSTRSARRPWNLLETCSQAHGGRA